MSDKVREAPEADKTEQLVAGGRVSVDDMRLIDMAAAFEGKKRGPFVAEAAVVRAREILGRVSPEVLEHFPA